MAYDIQLAQINTTTFGLAKAATAWGFPNGTDFHTLLMSFWMCGPVAGPGASGSAAIWPAFNGVPFFNFSPGTNNISFTNTSLGSSGHFYQGTFATPTVGTLWHVMMSVNTHTQVVQVYFNDQSISVTGGTWGGSPPYDFHFTTGLWFWDVAGAVLSARFPALADTWISNTPEFVDLSVTANRRKFINYDLSPVDLGNTGTNPFGYQPAMYMSVRPGGVAMDFLLNRGVGGGAWLNSGGAPLTFQADGSCTAPPPPPPKMSMDNVRVTSLTSESPCTAAVFSPSFAAVGPSLGLRWSDTRGQTFGEPVPQEFRDDPLWQPQWNRTGMARDRVFELFWTAARKTALNGAFIEVIPFKS